MHNRAFRDVSSRRSAGVGRRAPTRASSGVRCRQGAAQCMGTSPEHATSYPDEATMSEPLLTGPAAASLLGLDGFRDHVWPPMWLHPHAVSAAPGIIRTRSREPLAPVIVSGTRVAPVALVLTHLGHVPMTLRVDRAVTPRVRVEYALEHALRSGLVTLAELQSLRSTMPGAQLIRDVLALRRNEPPTESYAETSAVHIFRRLGHQPWAPGTDSRPPTKGSTSCAPRTGHRSGS